MSKSESATVSDQGGTAALSPDRGVSSTSLDVTIDPPVIVVRIPTDVPSSEAEVTSTSSGTCTSWNLSVLHAALEEKDPFLGMSEEDMNRLDSVLFSEEGQKALETSVPAAVASKGHVTVTATGTIDHMTSELPELNTIGHSDFVIDDVIIQEGLKEDLSAFADSFGDHGYCANPEPVPITLSSTRVAKEEERETEEIEKEKEESADENSKDGSQGTLPIRRSTRIHEHRQHQEAEHIMQENIEKEKKARKSLLGDESPSETVKKSPAVKHYNMRTKRPPRDYPDFVTPKQRSTRGKVLDGRGDGIEESKTEKGNNGQSDSDSSDSDDGGNTTGSTKGQRSVRGKTTRTRTRRTCKKEADWSNNEGEDERAEGTTPQKPAKRKSVKSKSLANVKTNTPSSSEDSDNDTLGAIRNRTKRVHGSNGRRLSESSDVPLSVVKGKLKEEGKIDGLKEDTEDNAATQAVLNKVRSKIEEGGKVKKAQCQQCRALRLADKGTGDTPKNGKPKKEVKSKPEDESDKDIGNSDKIVMKSKKRIRKGKKKQKGGEDGVKQKEDGAETKEKVTHEHGRDASDSSPALEEDSDSDWGSEDDPDRLWCICKKPYANRFMICCDECKDWFHGSCMGLTRKQGTDIVRLNHNWLCPKCGGKGGTRKTRERSTGSVSDDGGRPSESTSTITVSSIDTDEPAEPHAKILAEEAVTKDEEEDSEKGEARTTEKSNKSHRPPQKNEIEALQEQLQELKRKRQHRVAGPNDGMKHNEETKTRTKSTSGNSLEDRGGSAEDRRCAAEDRRSLAEDRRGSAEDRRSLAEDRRSLAEDRKSSAEDRRGSAEDRRGSAEDKALGKNKKKPSKVSRKECCIGTDCVKVARPGSVYCSDACITKHAQESLKLIGNERRKTYGNRSQPGVDATSAMAASERIVVFDRKTGKIVTGPVAPTPSTLESWLSRHASFEVLRPGSQVTHNTKSFYGTSGNKKEKPQPKRPDHKTKDAIHSTTMKVPVKDVVSSTSMSRHHSVTTLHRRDSASSNTSRDIKHSAKVQESKPHPPVAVPTRETVKSRPRISSGEHTRKPHEVKVRRDSQSAKKMKPETVAPPTEHNSGPDPVRISIRKMLRDLLNKRANDADDIMLSGTEIKQLALDIEDELFKYYGGVTSKYKNKYRSLVFNVKDPKNKGLFRKVMNAEIKPYNLVRLTSEQLASKELAMWREQETKHSLEMIEKSEKEVQKTEVIKKTHKGDVPVNDEDLSFLENKAEVTSDVISNVLTDDTTKQHKHHLFDLNCKICTGKMAPPADDEAPPQKRVRIGKTVVCGENKLSRLEEITIGEIRLRSQDDETHKNVSCDDDYVESVATSSDSIEPQKCNDVMSEDVINSHSKMASLNESATGSQGQRSRPSEAGLKTENKSGLKSCLKVKPGGVMTKASLSESSAVAVSTTTVGSPDSVPSSSMEVMPSQLQEPHVWKGFILIQDMLKFVTVAYHVSGPTDHLREELPATIDVRGRISPDQVWDYLSRLRHMIGTMRELTVIRFQFANVEEKSAYMQLYSYLSSRNRCGVIGCVGRVIKDMYLVPLASHDRIPSVLLPFDGPGLEVNRPHILLGILIKQKIKRPHPAGPRNIYTVRPEFREKGAPMSIEAEVPAKRVCVVDSDTSVTAPASTKLQKKPSQVKPHRTASGKEASPDSVIMEISEKQRSDPIVKEYALADPRTFANEPAPGSSPYSPPEDEEDEPYDPEYGLDSPVAMATTAKADVKTSTPTGVMPPGGSSTANVGSLVGQLVVGATTPTEITAAMLATLAGSSELSEQRKVLLQLTEKVEEQKRAIQHQMELTQRTKVPQAGGSTVESLTQMTMLEPNRMEPVTVAVVTPAISVEKPVQSIPMPIVTSDLYTPKSELGLSVVTKTHVATVNPIVDNKVQPVLSEGSVSTTQPTKSSLPADSKKVPDAIPNVARKRLTVKAGITPATTGVVAPFSGNLALLPPSVQMLLTGGAVQTPDNPCDNTQELQPATEGSSSSTGAEVKSPVDGNVSSNEVHTAKDAEKTSEDNPSNNSEIKQNSTPEFMEMALSDVTPSVGAHNAAAVRDLERTLQPPEAARIVLNPHGDVDYRIAPTGHFPTPPQLPPETGPQSSWQPAFQTKPQEASSGSPGVKAEPQPEWAPAFPAAVPPKQPGWAPVVPATKPLWEPAFPTATPPGVSRPADPRQRAAEERMRNAAFPPNAGRMDGSRQGEGAVPPMWNVPRPPVRPWNGAPPRLRFGAIPPPRPPVCMPMPPLPPSIPNAPPMPSGDIDERIRPRWPPGGDGRPWAQSGIRPLLPQPENTECKPAAVPTVDLSALGKFAVEFLKEQQQKGRGGVPPITSGNSSTVGIPLPANVLGIPNPANPALGIRPPAPPITRGQTDPLRGVSVDKRSDTDERCRTDSGQPIQQVTRSTAKFHDVVSPSQVGSLERQRQVMDNVTSLSQQQGNSKQVISSLIETANKRNAKSMQDKVKATVSGEKAKFVSEKKEGAKSDVEVANPCQVAKNDTDSEMTGKSKSKWVPLGSVASKQPQNRAVIAPSSGGTVQRVTEEVNILPSANKGGSTPTKLTPVQIKPLGKNLIETKTSQLLDPAETKPLLTSLAEMKLAQQSESAASVDVHSTRMLRGPTRSSSGDVQNKSQPSDKCQSKVESSSEDTTLVKPDTDSRSSGEAVSVSEEGSSKLLKDDKMNEKPRTNRTASTSRSADTGRRHRTKSRSRERIKKERRRSPSRDRYPASRRDRRRSRSKSRGHDRRAAKHRSRSRSRDREAKRRSRSRDRGVRRRTRSRSRGRSGVKRRSRSRSRDRDAKRRSRSRSRERRTSFRSDRGRHERRLENVGRRSPPPPIRHERGSREERVSNDEGFSHGLPQDVDHRAAGLGDRDERYSTAIPSLGEHVGHTDPAATKSHEKNILEGSRDTDERVEVGRQVLASPFVRNAAEPWSGRAPPGQSRVGDIRASGDTDDRDQWRHHGGQELFAEPQGRQDPTVPDPRAQPHGDAHMSPATFTRQPGDRPFTLRPPCDQAMPRGPPGWMPRMMGPRPPLVRPVGLPEQPPFPPRGPWARGPPAGPPGGRPGPW